MSSLPVGWATGTDANGRVYYVNHETKTTQWHPPSAPTAPPPSSAQHPPYAPPEPVKAVAVVEPAYAQAVPSGPAITRPPEVAHQPHTVVVVQQGAAPPPGAPPGGVWIQEKYCGLITWLVAIFVCGCVCCCPCDDRTVYQVGGVRYNQYGAIVADCCC